MPIVKQKTSGGNYFSPNLRVEYKPVDGKFNVYDSESRTNLWTPYKSDKGDERVGMDSLTIILVQFLYKFRTEDEVSSHFENLFTDDIVMRNSDTFTTVGTYKFSKEETEKLRNKKKPGIAIVNVNDATDVLIGRTNLVVAGVTDTAKTILFEVGGTVKMDLMKNNEKKTNVDKVNAFVNSELVTLVPQKEQITVGKGTKVKTIHLLDISNSGDINELAQDNPAVLEMVDLVRAEVDKEIKAITGKHDDESESDMDGEMEEVPAATTPAATTPAAAKPAADGPATDASGTPLDANGNPLF